MNIVRVEPALVAVVRRVVPWAQLADGIRSAMAVDLAPVRPLQRGHNVFVYRPRPEGMVEVGCGFQVAERFEAVGEIACDALPGGDAVHAVHLGPYHELGRTWEPLMAEIGAAGLPRGNVQWEVYGDWEEDPARLRTDIYVVVRPDP